MIIDFAVSNYRSIKEEVILSAVAQKGRKSEVKDGSRRWSDEQIAQPLMVEGANIGLLPCLCIFGANASGKSNVLMALDHLLGLMTTKNPETGLAPRVVVPFKLDSVDSHMPTRFELRVALDRHLTKGSVIVKSGSSFSPQTHLCGNIYTYSLSVKDKRIEEESLHYQPAGKKGTRLLYEGQWDEKTSRVVWENGADFRIHHVKYQSLIPEERSLLSTLESHYGSDVLEPLLAWLEFPWVGIGLGYERFDRKFAIFFIKHLPGLLAPRVSEIIRRFDTGIEKIEIEANEHGVADADDSYHVYVVHKTGHNYVKWRLEEESTGTQRLFVLASRMIWAFESGTPMIVDELDAHIHPHITHAIIRMFQNPRTNPRRSQLIFTSHDYTLQGGDLMRRDEIWYTEKRPDSSTDLFPLTAFPERKNLATDRAYMDGRFGAVPILPSEEELAGVEEMVA